MCCPCRITYLVLKNIFPRLSVVLLNDHHHLEERYSLQFSWHPKQRAPNRWSDLDQRLYHYHHFPFDVARATMNQPPCPARSIRLQDTIWPVVRGVPTPLLKLFASTIELIFIIFGTLVMSSILILICIQEVGSDRIKTYAGWMDLYRLDELSFNTTTTGLLMDHCLDAESSDR